MQAIQIAGYGASEQLHAAECEQPKPGPRQLLVRVLAASVNPIDWKLRRGSLRAVMHPSFPLVLGFDICGEVVDIGPGASKFEKGSLVYARLDSRFGGAYAQYALVGEDFAARKPERLSPIEAAAVPLAALTALQALRDKAKLKPGEHVLVVGGSGGVGHFGVQIAKAMGAHVAASCGTSNLELVRGLGAEHVIDYRKEPYRSFEAPYDVVLDTAIANPFSTFAPLLAANGRYVAATPSPELLLRMPLLWLSSRKRISFVMLKPNGTDLEELRTWIDEGKLRPVVDRVFPFSETGAAHAYAEQGHVRGKVVIDVTRVA